MEWPNMIGLLKKLAFKLYQAINPQNLKKSSSLGREPVNRPTIIRLVLIYTLVLAVYIYVSLTDNGYLLYIGGISFVIYVLFYVPISFLRKPGWSRFLTRIVPAIICIVVFWALGSSQFEYWWRASEFERDVVAAQAKNPSVEHVKWSSWLKPDSNFDKSNFDKSYYYVADESKPFIASEYEQCTSTRVEKIKSHYYVVTFNLNC